MRNVMAIAKREFQIYKIRTRPLINHANLYHITDRPDGVHFDAIQYVDPKKENGMLFAFRGTTADSRHTFHLKGLNPRAQYELTFEDNDLPAVHRRGAELMRDGIEISLPEPQSSQLIYIKSPG